MDQAGTATGRRQQNHSDAGGGGAIRRRWREGRVCDEQPRHLDLDSKEESRPTCKILDKLDEHLGFN